MNITVIGCGNMGGAMVHGWCLAGMASQITVTANTQATLDRYAARYPRLTVCLNNVQAAAYAQVVVIAVKPWLVDNVMAEILPSLQPDTVVISVAAGVRHSRIDVYAMPNIAVEYGQGMTFIEYNGSQHLSVAEQLFSLFGRVQTVAPHMMDAGMQLSGCGIAYIMRYVRAMTQGGVELGLRPADALATVLQTMKGAVALLEESGKHPEAAIDTVTTPGGYTIRGLNAMEDAGFTRAVLAGLKAENK